MPLDATDAANAEPTWYVVVVYASRDGGGSWREFMRGQQIDGGSGDMTQRIHGHLANLREAHPGLLFQAEAYHPSVPVPP